MTWEALQSPESRPFAAVMIECSEIGVALWRLAFGNHCELCDAVQRRHGNADDSVMGHSLRELAKMKLPLVGSVRL